jgi:hypothetical protein
LPIGLRIGWNPTVSYLAPRKPRPLKNQQRFIANRNFFTHEENKFSRMGDGFPGVFYCRLIRVYSCNSWFKNVQRLNMRVGLADSFFMNSEWLTPKHDSPLIKNDCCACKFPIFFFRKPDVRSIFNVFKKRIRAKRRLIDRKSATPFVLPARASAGFGFFGTNKMNHAMKNISLKISSTPHEVKSPLDSNKEKISAKFQSPARSAAPRLC